MAREVKIVVKNVYAPAELQQFIVEETALVKQLKQLVAEQFPGNPLPAHQKLIFGGKICADSDPLQKILNVNQVQSEECAEEATAVVFHLLVTSVPPRSGPSTPPASAKPQLSTQQSGTSTAPAVTAAVAAPAPAARTLSRISSDIPSSDRAVIDSPRPTSSNRTAALPALDISAGVQSATHGVPQQPQAAHFTFPAFGQFPGYQIPHAPAAAVATPHANHASQQQQHDLFTQGMLMHQQAMILGQIQYLQYLKTHYQQVGGVTNQERGQPGAPIHNNNNGSAAAAQAQHHQFAQYAQFGHYYGMGMHQPHMYPAMHGIHHPGVHPVGPAATVGAGFPHAHHPATMPVPAAAAAAPAAPRQNTLIVQIAREILPLFDIRLAMKMAFMLFIIGQDTPNDRVLMLALLSFISYLHLTGILAKVYEVYKRHYAPAPDANADANQNAADANNNNNANANAGAGRLRGVAAGLARLDFTRVLRISSDRGFVQDVKYFFVGFLLSLVPAWHPQPFQGAAAPPVVQDMPDVAEMPVQGI